MPTEPAEPGSLHELIEAYAHGNLDDGPQKREIESLLEQSQPYRELFRRLTAGRYPHGDGYTIIEQIGKGGFGVVYKAIPHAKERIEALKVLFSKTPLLTEYFQNEVRLIARLRHPNIATLYDAQLSTPPLYYTMEFVQGERLNEYLKKYTVSLAARLAIIKAVAEAIGYAHGQGVVHRDLKPQNILVDKEGTPHIIDFGIGKKLALVAARTTEGANVAPQGREGPVGTLGYISPEQEKGGMVDERADIFALGALLFQCVTGEPARLARIADHRIRILKQRQVVQPEDLAAIIGRCVETSPDDRYQTCADFIADLDNYLIGRPIQARGTRSWGYRAYRIGMLVMRSYPTAVRVSIVFLVAGLLTWLFWGVETHAALMPQRESGNQTMMIGFADSTVRALVEGRIGAGLPELYVPTPEMLEGPPFPSPPSWRMIYGQVFERLAEATPLVILWDSYPDKCSKFDEYLLRGLRAVRAKGVPVFVGSLRFDINGEPLLCATIRAAVDGYGAIVGIAGKHPDSYEVAYCIERPFVERPIPGLALAAYAATRFGDCDLRLRLHADTQQLELQYRKRNPKPGESHYEQKTNEISLHRVYAGAQSQDAFLPLKQQGALREDDKIATALVRARPNAYWRARTIPVEDVLTADTQQLKQWFDHQAIVIGQMRAMLDQFFLGEGTEPIFGCQVHAEAIDNLLSGAGSERVARAGLALRSVVWCGLAVVVISLWRQRARGSLRLVTLMCVLLFAAGVTLGGESGFRFSERWLLELSIAVSGCLTAGSLAFWTKAVRERQLRLTPAAATLPSEGPTLQSTALAETR